VFVNLFDRSIFSENTERVKRGDKVAVIGASGYLGGCLCESLTASGYDVVKISRSQRGEGWRKWSEGCLDGVKAVFNFAGLSVDRRWTEEVKQKLWDSRVKPSEELANWIGRMPAEERPEVVITASGIGIFGDRGDEELVENSKTGDTFLAKLCVAWEEKAKLVSEHGVRSVSMRFGAVLGKESKALKQMVIPYKMFVGGALGNGKSYFSWIHEKDAVASMVFALENREMEGGVNVVAEVVTQLDFAKSLGKVLSRPSVFFVPKFVLKMFLGEFGEAILGSLRAQPKKLTDNGFEFQYYELEPALRELIG